MYKLILTWVWDDYENYVYGGNMQKQGNVFSDYNEMYQSEANAQMPSTECPFCFWKCIYAAGIWIESKKYKRMLVVQNLNLNLCALPKLKLTLHDIDHMTVYSK